MTTPHERALTLLFAEIGEVVAREHEVLLGTPGSLDERTNENGTKYWVRRYSDAVGRRLEAYLGTLDDTEVASKVRGLEAQIASTNANFARCDRRERPP